MGKSRELEKTLGSPGKSRSNLGFFVVLLIVLSLFSFSLAPSKKTLKIQAFFDVPRFPETPKSLLRRSPRRFQPNLRDCQQEVHQGDGRGATLRN